MPINIDSALGLHARALVLRAERADVLASNLANADTPNYKARDLDFRTALDAASETAPVLRRTNPNHLGLAGVSASGAELRYRIPNQASLDGNTVDTQQEKAAYAENALRYQASLDFLNGRIRTLMSAIRGE